MKVVLLMKDNKIRCCFVDDETGKVYIIPKGIKYISRNSADSIVPISGDKKFVSHPHLEVVYGGSKTPPMIFDCNSSNGSYINGERVCTIGPTPTRIGDIISLGSSDYKHPSKNSIHLRVELCVEI